MLTKIKDLTGYILHCRDGEIGKVKEFYFDDLHWAIRYLIADTGSWLAGRQVLLSPYALLSVDKVHKQIAVDLSKKQIEDSPLLPADKPISQQFETAYYRYYGWPLYWGGSYAWGNWPILIRDPGKRKSIESTGNAWNPHLSSTLRVKGYHIQTLDGEIGHVKDCIIDDRTWAINYMVVDTYKWIKGRIVLIPLKWIKRVSWDESKVIVNLSRAAIKKTPEYAEKSLFTRVYETIRLGPHSVIHNEYV
ncbi:MAG: photosystem reaction center subunit H [Spirochaetae bacterium HGW-Spirochaetae-8]|nr:MAG: photosystem reaction center subunit H [Spirochaetae bacterium HGW-Spirochaetae-8]